MYKLTWDGGLGGNRPKRIEVPLKIDRLNDTVNSKKELKPPAYLDKANGPDEAAKALLDYFNKLNKKQPDGSYGSSANGPKGPAGLKKPGAEGANNSKGPADFQKPKDAEDANNTKGTKGVNKTNGTKDANKTYSSWKQVMAQINKRWEEANNGGPQLTSTETMALILDRSDDLTPAQKLKRYKALCASANKIKEAKNYKYNGMTFDQANAIYTRIRNKYQGYLAVWKPNPKDARFLQLDEDALEQIIAKKGSPGELAEYRRAKEAREKTAEHVVKSGGQDPRELAKIRVNTK